MNAKKFLIFSISLGLAIQTNAQEWSLRQCLDHALDKNIQIQQSRLQEASAEADLWQARGELFPSLNFSTTQSIGYRPFEETMAVVQNGQVTTTDNRFTYQGSYGLNASLTLWNGGINQKNIEAQKLQGKIAELQTRQNEQSIQEQIAQLYVQIMYSAEAVRVNQQLEQTAKSQYDRGQQMMEQGQMSRADVAQLEAQWRSAQYDVVSGETTVANLKRQLKALLQLPMEQEFDVSGTFPSESQVLEPLPSKEETLRSALSQRAEIKSAQLDIAAADLQRDIARRGFLPTVSLNAGIGESHYSGSQKSVGEQMKTNLNMSAGVTLSVPILDNRRNRTNVKKAVLQQQTARLSLEDKKTTLSSTIEELWLNAASGQQRYLSAKAQTQSQKTSYDLLDEQFKNGLKNIVELLQGRDQLLNAKQSELQSKYQTLLNIQLLKFYTGEEIRL